MLNNYAGYTKDQLTHLIAVALRTERPDLTGHEVLSEAMNAMEALCAAYYQKGYRDAPAKKPETLDELLAMTDDES